MQPKLQKKKERKKKQPIMLTRWTIVFSVQIQTGCYLGCIQTLLWFKYEAFQSISNRITVPKTYMDCDGCMDMAVLIAVSLSPMKTFRGGGRSQFWRSSWSDRWKTIGPITISFSSSATPHLQPPSCLSRHTPCLKSSSLSSSTVCELGLCLEEANSHLVVTGVGNGGFMCIL